MSTQALENGWFANGQLVDGLGQQSASLEYPNLSREEIFSALEKFYRSYYFRPRPIARMLGEMIADFSVMKRRLREGAEFLRFLNLRNSP